MDRCKYWCEEVCCNDSSEHLADFPSKEDCAECEYYEKVINDKSRTNQ